MSSSTQPAPSQTPAKRPTFRMFDMVLFSVCAMLLLSQLTVTAGIGTTAVFWTIIIIIFFFLPYGLATAEMGSTYPDAGGIYSWVVRAFGRRWGTRVSWWYWVNVALWVPSVYLMFSGTLSTTFFEGRLSFWVQVAITLALIWLNYWVSTRSLDVGAWVSNLGAGITVFVILVIGVVAAIRASSEGSATEFTMDSMMPHTGLPALALALPIIIYNFLGFELMSSASNQMENPKRDVPRTIFIAGALIGGFYLIATIGMQVITPAGDISETTGLIDVLRIGMGTSAAATAFLNVLGVGSLFCFFAGLIPWTIGANLAASESAQQGDLPRFFGYTHPDRGTPVGSALTCSIVGTVVTIGYALLFSFTGGAVDDLFWNLFAFSSVIFLLPYIVMMLAFAKLRLTDSARPRPYRVPGGTAGMWATTIIPTIFLVLAAIFFVVNPFEFDSSATIPIFVGLILTVIIQEFFTAKAPSWRKRILEDEGITDEELDARTAAPADDSE